MKRSNRIIVVLLALVVSLGTFWACKRTMSNDEVLGNAQLMTAPAGFTGIVGAVGPVTRLWSRASIPPGNQGDVIDETFKLNFAPSSYHNVFFENELSHEVTWYINLKGVNSGAEKKFTGTGKYIDSNQVFWDGSADGYRFFVKGETVHYTVSFLGTSISYTDSLTINNSVQGAKKYTGSIKILGNGDTLRYKLIDDFDTQLPSASVPGCRTSYSDLADGSGKSSFYTTDRKQVGGYFSYYMIGTDNNGNGYMGGASGEALTEMHNFTTEKDPSKVFFNVYIYGYGRPNSALFLQAYENDFANPPSFPLPRDKGQNDMWYSIVNVNWTGWKLVSIPYSSFKPANNPLSGGGGNRIKEPNKLCGFGIELESYPTPGLTIELAIDEIYLTENAPFQP